MIQDLNMKHLIYFTETVKSQSLTKTANKLFVSQSTISKAIASLEKSFEFPLMERRGKVWNLTNEGEIIYRYAEEILESIDNKLNSLHQELQSIQGTLHLGLPPSTGFIIFSEIIGQFRKNYPKIQLETHEITSLDLVEDVSSGKLDLGIVVEPFHHAGFEIAPVITSEAVLVVSKEHPFADRKQVSFDELKDENFLMISKNYMYYGLVMEKFHKAGFTPKISMESYQWDMILELISSNQGVSILPKPLIEKGRYNNLVGIHLENPTFSWGLSLIYKDNKNTSLVHAFLSCIGKN